jgi:WD40 repeat protein/serine/threonine protein kinase
VCGDTTIVLANNPAEPVFVVAFDQQSHANGQDATQSIPGVAQESHATATFQPHEHNDQSQQHAEPSFDSLAKMLIPESSSSETNSRDPSSVVPFGPNERPDFTPPRVPGYEILHEVGRGGMGVVYKARQSSLNRLVALKMILSGVHAGPTERERFKREAEAVAALQHPQIVQIFDIGEANGHPYLALEFVEGGSLAQHLTGKPWNERHAAELVASLARAMQFAHDAGIVHRDLKPGNILINSDTKLDDRRHRANSNSSTKLPNIALPKVTDFGLAKRIDETLGGDGTRTGAVMGTPSYIAPEQASGKNRDIGPAADVYALGAILYELLTGRPPFRGETPLETVLQVLHDDPVPPKRLHPHVPRDLETICLKCLSKQPAQRYSSASALAEDIDRYLNGEPIKARPLGAWGRAVKWARRHPALAGLTGVAIVATVALVSVLSVAYYRVSEARDAKEHERITAQRERDRATTQQVLAENLAKENERQRNEAIETAKKLAAVADSRRRAAFALQLAQVAFVCERDPARAARLLDDETLCPTDLRDFAWAYLRRLCQRDDRVYREHQTANDRLRAVACSPLANFVATAGDSGRIRVWDPKTGRTWLTLSGHETAVVGIAFSPDGTLVASAGEDGSVRLWVLPLQVLATARRTANWAPWLPPIVDPILGTPDIPATLSLTSAHANGATCVAFSPDGRTLVSGGNDGYLRWWEIAGWRPATPDIALLGGVGATATAIVRASKSPDARAVWEINGFPAHRGGVLNVSFAQNANVLVSGGNDNIARVFTADGSKQIQQFAHAEPVRAIAVSPDGRTVATANYTGATPTSDGAAHIRLYNTQTGRDRRLFGHTATIYSLAISDDGLLLASTGFDKTVRLWDLQDGRERGLLVGHSQGISSLAFTPDKRSVITASSDGTAIVWQTALRTHESEDLLKFQREIVPKTPPQALVAGGVNDMGNAFVGVDDLGRLRIAVSDFVPPGRDPPPGARGPLSLVPLPIMPAIPLRDATAAAISPDGRTFAVAVRSGLLVWQLPPRERPQPGFAPRRNGKPVLVKVPLAVHAIMIDSTGHWLFTLDTDGMRKYELSVFSANDDQPPQEVRGELLLAVADARVMAFHPNHEWIAVGVASGIQIIDSHGKPLAHLPNAHDKPRVESLAFDSSGTLLASGDASGRIKLWEVSATGQPKALRDLVAHSGAIQSLAFNPSGRTLASGSDDRTVILWDPFVGQERLTLTGHSDIVRNVAFSADGEFLTTVSRDGAVKRWRADLRAAHPNTANMLPVLPGSIMRDPNQY